MIEVQELRKRYRRRDVLDGVSFTADKGRITCLIGMNGAGKSTVLKAIMGLVPYRSGTIRIGGEPPSPAVMEKIAFIPDRLMMPGGMRVREALAWMQEHYARWNPARAEELLAFFRLDPAARIAQLSRGTEAKLNLVLGLSRDTDYVLMDEPFSGIDMLSREQIADVFTSELVERRGVLLTTHEIAEMERLIDQAVFLDQGRVVRDFDCERMREDEGKSVVDVMREVYRA
ncbi:ABC transporter ATP-binding protein [Paenibacillus sp. IB182496]|uniref:ABC transporter ATP-binding protein n=1 Tax=Paenibacillus sabuli TaxID=2772509 RepID=A0A927BNN4_9BACL|nr:ABC transporter ATP-binding protein [Paenibacillus sabuli]MBD2843883.1 ABC transporter ATP-binding protein [Paenibacillus sabuli]